MENERIAINIRVSQEFIDKIDEHIKRINSQDQFGRKLSRSMFIRSTVEKAVEEASNVG